MTCPNCDDKLECGNPICGRDPAREHNEAVAQAVAQKIDAEITKGMNDGSLLLRIRRGEKTPIYQRYVHHGSAVMVRENLKGRHREHCLCHDCDNFKPGTDGHCQKAQRLFQLCVEEEMTTPVFECPRFWPQRPEEQRPIRGGMAPSFVPAPEPRVKESWDGLVRCPQCQSACDVMGATADGPMYYGCSRCEVNFNVSPGYRRA